MDNPLSFAKRHNLEYKIINTYEDFLFISFKDNQELLLKYESIFGPSIVFQDIVLILNY